jgi:hypothetical protein
MTASSSAPLRCSFTFTPVQSPSMPGPVTALSAVGWSTATAARPAGGGVLHADSVAALQSTRAKRPMVVMVVIDIA